MTQENEWPLCLPNQLILGNLDADTVVVICWSPRKPFVKKMQEIDEGIMDVVAAVGNLYTQERGLDFLVRNLLANRKITRVIITGADKTGSGAALHSLLEGPRDNMHFPIGGDSWSLDGFSKVNIRRDITGKALDYLRGTVRSIWAGESPASAVEIIESAPKGILRGETFYFPPPEPDATTFPTHEHGHVIRGPDVPSVYLDMLYEILTFGRVGDTHYDQKQKELLDLVTVITAQEPRPEELPEFIPFDLEHLAEYDAALNNPVKDPDVTYSYGNRIREYFGTDQFKDVALKLLNERECRSAVISLWDPAREGTGKIQGSPCLNQLWFRIRSVGEQFPALHLTAIIRSNDMYTGWPENAYGLRMLQERLRIYYLCMTGKIQDDSGLTLGDLVIMSESAHLYQDCWEPAQEIVDTHRKKGMVWDPKGNWTLDVDRKHKKIVMKLLDPKGFEILELRGPTAAYLRKRIAERNLISDVGHALYIGAGLAGAEDELRRLNGLEK